MQKKHFLTTLFLVFFAFSPTSRASAKSIIQKISFDQNDNIEISLDNSAKYKVYSLENPDRIVVDVENSSYKSSIPIAKSPNFIDKIRYSKHRNFTRIVFDLKQKANIKSTSYKKYKGQKFGKIHVQITPEITYVLKKGGGVVDNSKSKESYHKKVVATKKVPIIVIDAGHGGKDPGAIGRYYKTREKDLTLSYSKSLAYALSKSKKYKIYLTRDSDVFIPLSGRVAKARKVKADLFISLHANSAENRSAEGFSIYTLSKNASDKQAEKLARKENRADIISGINFENASYDILSTLIDLSQRSSMNHSSSFANIAIKNVRQNGIKVVGNSHRFAGFVVLTAPDMVSILIELGYISNKGEEKLLNNNSYKQKIINGLVASIDEYFKFR